MELLKHHLSDFSKYIINTAIDCQVWLDYLLYNVFKKNKSTKSVKRILVTGSSGKLGKEIVCLLRMNNYNVFGIDLLKSDTTNEIIDIRDGNSVKAVTKNIDAIIHTAALHGKHTDLNFSRANFIDTNIHGTNNLLWYRQPT